MAYTGLAWPGLTLSIKALNVERAKYARWIKTLDENPKLFKRPTTVRQKYKAMLADIDTGLKVLRDAERAMAAPPRPRRVRAKTPAPA